MFIRQGRAVLDFDREQTCVVVMFTRIAHRPIANMDNIALHMQLTAGVGMGVKVVYNLQFKILHSDYIYSRCVPGGTFFSTR